MSDNDDAIADEFWPPAEDKHPANIAARLIKDATHSHLEDAQILWLMRAGPVLEAGRQVIGRVQLPQVQGKLRDLFTHLLVKTYGFLPEFIVTIDAQWWQEATALQREALVWHELSHVRQAVDKNGEPRFDKETGAPVLAIIGHDIEEFRSTVERYGEWAPHITEFREALERGRG